MKMKRKQFKLLKKSINKCKIIKNIKIFLSKFKRNIQKQGLINWQKNLLKFM